MTVQNDHRSSISKQHVFGEVSKQLNVLYCHDRYIENKAALQGPSKQKSAVRAEELQPTNS